MSKEVWMWLADGLGYGAVNSGELLEAYPGGAKAVKEALGDSALDDILTLKQAEKLASSRPEDFALPLGHAEKSGVTVIPYDDPGYPSLLRNIPNPPPVLYVKGDASLLNDQLSVGMIGTRRASAYGVEAMQKIAKGVALGGAIIVSGLAAGLDSEAHKAALSVNGPTIACIAFGHDRCYPANNKQLKEVIERHGAVVSEYPVGTGPEKAYFLQRNRLIAGLSHALVVAEARERSGTMSTVNFASEYGRDVFAIPGSVFSALSGGTNAMIREGAYVAASANDVLNLYGIEIEEEDLTKSAEKQSKEGRPEASSGQGGMRQMPPSPIGYTRKEPAAPTINTQQNKTAPRGVEERAAAVSDQVDFKSAPKSDGKEGDKKVQRFEWEKLERIDTKKETPATPPVKKDAAPAKEQPAPSKEVKAKAAEADTAKKSAEKADEAANTAKSSGTSPLANRLRTLNPPKSLSESPRGRQKTTPPSAPKEPVKPAKKAKEPAPSSFASQVKTQMQPPQDAAEDLSANAKKALAQLGPKAVALSHICDESGLSSGEAMAALTELELAGLSRQLAGRQFILTNH